MGTCKPPDQGVGSMGRRLTKYGREGGMGTVEGIGMGRLWGGNWMKAGFDSVIHTVGHGRAEIRISGA